MVIYQKPNQYISKQISRLVIIGPSNVDYHDEDMRKAYAEDGPNFGMNVRKAGFRQMLDTNTGIAGDFISFLMKEFSV